MIAAAECTNGTLTFANTDATIAASLSVQPDFFFSKRKEIEKKGRQLRARGFGSHTPQLTSSIGKTIPLKNAPGLYSDRLSAS